MKLLILVFLLLSGTCYAAAAVDDYSNEAFLGQWVLSADPSLKQTDRVEIFADGKIISTAVSGRVFEGRYRLIEKQIRALFDVKDARIGLLFQYDPETDVLIMSSPGTNERAIYWRDGNTPTAAQQ